MQYKKCLNDFCVIVLLDRRMFKLFDNGHISIIVKLLIRKNREIENLGFLIISRYNTGQSKVG